MIIYDGLCDLAVVMVVLVDAAQTTTAKTVILCVRTRATHSILVRANDDDDDDCDGDCRTIARVAHLHGNQTR